MNMFLKALLMVFVCVMVSDRVLPAHFSEDKKDKVIGVTLDNGMKVLIHRDKGPKKPRGDGYQYPVKIFINGLPPEIKGILKGGRSGNRRVEFRYNNANYAITLKTNGDAQAMTPVGRINGKWQQGKKE